MSEASPISLTTRAIQMGKRQLVEYAGTSEEDPIGLRLGVRGGGCSGYYYVYEVATELGKRDQRFDFDGLQIIVDARSLKLLAGGTLDWEQKLMGYGFKWRNPNAVSDCGCGSSFNVA